MLRRIEHHAADMMGRKQVDRMLRAMPREPTPDLPAAPAPAAPGMHVLGKDGVWR